MVTYRRKLVEYVMACGRRDRSFTVPHGALHRLWHARSVSMRVLHVTHGTTTGLAHCVADWVREQVLAGMSVTVACPRGRLTQLGEQAGARVVEWRASRAPGFGMWRERGQLARIVADARPDVVHLHCAKAGLLGRLILRGRVPTVFSPHAWSFLAVEGTARRVVREWERFAARWTTVTVCVSQGEATTGRGSGIRGRFDVLPNESDVDELVPITERDRGGLRAELGISAGAPLAVVAARMCRQKGQDVAIAAWPKVRDVVPNAELVLLGDGPTRHHLAEQAGDPDASGVRLHGLVDRNTTLRWMYAADVVVCPSRWEGMSLVPLEALALGRPVVVSDTDGMREGVPVQAGLLVPVDQPEPLATAVSRLLSDPGLAMTMGETGRRAAMSEHGKRHEPGKSGTASAARRLAQLYPTLVER